VACALAGAALASSAFAGATPRVVGGALAAPGQFPFAVALVQHNVPAERAIFCGGSVISPTAILTAAHCVNGSSPGDFDVVAGRQLLSGTGGERIGVTNIAVEPGYNPGTNQHDDAVLTLATPTSAPPVALAQPSQPGLYAEGTPLLVAGWGLTSNDAGTTADALQVGAIQSFPDARCAGYYGDGYDPSLMMCAGSPAGVPDSCRGDSGGPLVASDGSSVREVGLVAFGGATCGDPTIPGVYTRVAAEAAWISSQVGLPAPAPAPTPAPAPAPTPKPSSFRLRTRVTNVTCGLTRCRIAVSLTGSNASLSSVLVRIHPLPTCRHSGRSRRLRCTHRRDSFATARRVRGSLWSASVRDLPLGKLRIYASPRDRRGRKLAAAGTVLVRVRRA
jgi:hypothetical protein